MRIKQHATRFLGLLVSMVLPVKFVTPAQPLSSCRH